MPTSHSYQSPVMRLIAGLVMPGKPRSISCCRQAAKVALIDTSGDGSNPCVRKMNEVRELSVPPTLRIGGIARVANGLLIRSESLLGPPAGVAKRGKRFWRREPRPSWKDEERPSEDAAEDLERLR